MNEKRSKEGKGRTRLSTARTQHRLVSNLVVVVVDVDVDDDDDDDAVPTFNVFGARVVSISPKPSQATATFHRQLGKKMVVVRLHREFQSFRNIYSDRCIGRFVFVETKKNWIVVILPIKRKFYNLRSFRGKKYPSFEYSYLASS